MYQSVFRCLLAALLVTAGALPAFPQDAVDIHAAPTVAAGERDGGQPAAPGADKEGLARCGLYGLVALYGVNSPGICTFDLEDDERNNAIGVLDARNNVIALIALECLLGSNGGGLFDVVIAQDCTALISNFGDSQVHFVDFSDPLNPLHKGTVNVGFFAEDIALTPDGQYALVTDGGFSPKIAVIRVPTMHRVGVFNFPGTSNQAVAVSSDGQTVLTADYFGRQLNVFLLGEGGALQFVKSIPLFTDTDGIAPDMSHYPVNVAISPDGRTAVVANANGGNIDDPPFAYAHPPDLDLFRIDGPGQVHHSGVIHMPNAGGVQSVGFAGNQIFFNYYRWFDWDTLPYAMHFVGFADVTGPGQAVNTGIEVATSIKGTSQLFGVDTLVAVPGGPFLYYSNPTVSGGAEDIQVIDLRDHTLITTIDIPNSDLHYIYGPSGWVSCCEGYIPLGIAFRQP